MIGLVALLGNPGKQYAGNRHNVPWHLVDVLPFENSLSWRKKFKGLWADLDTQIFLDYFPVLEVDPAQTGANEKQNLPVLAEKIHFLKPGTFMNRSGEPVLEAASFFKIKPEGIIVIHDELELPLGTISLKYGGGLGGHNGLRSMKACFKTPDFWRLRIGIGRPDSRLPGQGGREGSGEGIVDWVLSDFDNEEKTVLEPTFKTASDLLISALILDPVKLLPKWSKVKVV